MSKDSVTAVGFPAEKHESLAKIYILKDVSIHQFSSKT